MQQGHVSGQESLELLLLKVREQDLENLRLKGEVQRLVRLEMAVRTMARVDMAVRELLTVLEEA